MEKETQKEKIERLEEFYNGIKRLVRELGKSNVMMKSDIENLLVEHKDG